MTIEMSEMQILIEENAVETINDTAGVSKSNSLPQPDEIETFIEMPQEILGNCCAGGPLVPYSRDGILKRCCRRCTGVNCMCPATCVARDQIREDEWRSTWDKKVTYIKTAVLFFIIVTLIGLYIGHHLYLLL